MSDQVMQEIREKVARLEAVFESDGRNTKETLTRISDTQDKMLDVIQEIAGTQREMKHIVSVTDVHSEKHEEADRRLDDIEKGQEKQKVIIGGVVFVAGGTFLTALSAAAGWLS